MAEPGPSADSTDLAGAATATGPYAVLQNRDFLLYLIGRFIASLGQQMLTVAVGWELYERTHSALALGLVGLTQMVPMILLILPSGHVADSYNRKRIILLTVLVIALASFGLTAISWLRADVFWIYMCLLAAGTARNLSMAGQRRVHAATGIAREFLARCNVEHRWLSSVVGRGARGGRGLDCAHSQRGGCICDQWRSVVDLRRIALFGADTPCGHVEREDDIRKPGRRV
jgi:hypothetical protein